jgi:IS30 family transposase
MERIQALRADGWSDERIAVLFGTHRTTISRLRRAMEDGEMAPEPVSVLDRMLARGAKRRALLDRINDAEPGARAGLWAEVAAL